MNLFPGGRIGEYSELTEEAKVGRNREKETFPMKGVLIKMPC
jgi:hypothetical protein